MTGVLVLNPATATIYAAAHAFDREVAVEIDAPGHEERRRAALAAEQREPEQRWEGWV